MSTENGSTMESESKQSAIVSEEKITGTNNEHEVIKSHVKARSEKAGGYPDRFPVADGVTWDSVDRTEYKPAEYTAPSVIANDRSRDPSNPRLWADPENPLQAMSAPDFPSYIGEISLDEHGRPLNPMGPTGISGRGLLGNWGPNYAADPIVTRLNKHNQIEMIVIQRKDTSEWAIPGGMVDRGERVTATLKRELGEETSASFDFDEATPIYQGYVDDPRNTDNAWMETDAYHLHLGSGVDAALEAKDDATDVRWQIVTPDFIQSLYASHGNLVHRAIALWEDHNHSIIAENGTVDIAGKLQY